MQKPVLIGVGLASLLLVCCLFGRRYRLRYQHLHQLLAKSIAIAILARTVLWRGFASLQNRPYPNRADYSYSWDWVRGQGHPLRLFTVVVLVASTMFWAHQALSFEWAAPKGSNAIDEGVGTTAAEEILPEAVNLPFAVDAESGTVWTIFGLEIVGKVMSAQTNGEYAVVITTTPPNGGPPLHVHQREDEMFYVMKGTYEFQFGDETVLATEGDIVHLPRYVPHRFRNIGSEPGTTMNMIIPGGFEQFFVEIDQLPKDQPPDRQQVADIASRYGLEFLPDA